MMFLQLKVAGLVAAFKIAQDGDIKRPLGLGITLAILFSLCSLPSSGFAADRLLAEILLGLLLCPLIMFQYWKLERVLPSLAVAGFGSMILLLVLPLLAAECVTLLSGA